MQTFNFKEKTFNFPIEVYLYFPKQLIGFLSVVLVLFCATIFIVSIINTHLFGVILAILFIVILATLAFLYKKPKFIIYPDKLVLIEHGLIKPKTLYWQDCYLYAYQTKHHSSGKILDFLHFLYKDDKDELQRFATINLNQIRFENQHFGVEDTLEFFNQLVGKNKQL